MFAKGRLGQVAFRVASVLASLLVLMGIVFAGRTYAGNLNSSSSVNTSSMSDASIVSSSSSTSDAGTTSNSDSIATDSSSTSEKSGIMATDTTDTADIDGNTSNTDASSEEISIYDAAKAADDGSDDIAFVNASSEKFRLHMQTYGSQIYASDVLATEAGEQAQSFEVVRITLMGELAKDYDVWYRVHARDMGWLAWVKNGELAGTSGLSWRLGSLQIIILPKGSSASDYVTDIQSVVDSAYLVFPGAFDLTRTRTRASSWQEWDVEGEAFGVFGQTRYLEAAKIKTTGDISSVCNAWYRTLIKEYGWLGWALNGQVSGVVGRTNRVEALEIRLMPKDAAALGSTTSAYRALISGDAELDSILDAIINTQTSMGQNALREAFDYITTLPYIDGETEYRGDWREWSIPVAKQMYQRPGGNCYGYGALMAWVARALGYEAKAVSGDIQSGVLVWSYHGWCEITQGGKTYVLDPDLQKYVPDRNFFMVSYEDAPTYYTAYDYQVDSFTIYGNASAQYTYYTLD